MSVRGNLVNQRCGIDLRVADCGKEQEQKSGADAELLAQLKRDFATVKHVKPAASRQDSSERYVLATGFRGDGAPAS